MFFRITGLIIPSFILSGVVLTACSPTTVEIEPTQATIYEIPVTVAYPEAPVELNLVSELPGMMRLIGYSGGEFVTGTVQVSNRDWIPNIEKSGSKVNLVQTAKTKVSDSQELTNLWKLRVSDNEPFSLVIRNGQAEGHWNLSGLPITNLYAELGTTKNAFTFDELNPTVMQKCELHCGTGDVVAEGILNAACQNMVIEAGKGNLTLRFGGKEILQDLNVIIKAGGETISVSVLPDIPTSITVGGGNQVIVGDDIFRTDGSSSGSSYTTASYRDTLSKTVHISISSGSCTVYLNPPPS